MENQYNDYKPKKENAIVIIDKKDVSYPFGLSGKIEQLPRKSDIKIGENLIATYWG